MPELPRTPTSRGGRPRKYHTLEERKNGINAVRRARRYQARNRQQRSTDEGLNITFERCAVLQPVGSKRTGLITPLRSRSPVQQICLYDDDRDDDDDYDEDEWPTSTVSNFHSATIKEKLWGLISIIIPSFIGIDD